MYQKNTTLLLEKTGFSKEYLELVNKVFDISKTIRSTEARKSIIEAMYYELPDEFSCEYIDLAINTKGNLMLLVSIFSELKDKAVLREEIKKGVSKIKSQKKKIKVLYEIFDTEDKELILYYKDLVKELVSEDVLTRWLLLLQISLYSDNLVEKNQIQNQIVSEVLSVQDMPRVYSYLNRLLDGGLTGKAKEKAVNYAIKNWLKANFSLQDKIEHTRIVKHFPSKDSERIVCDLYKEIKKVNENKDDKTVEVDMLLNLADEQNNAHFSFLYSEAFEIVKKIKDKEKLALGTLCCLADVVPEELAVELTSVVLHKFSLGNKPEVLIEVMLNILANVSSRKHKDILNILSNSVGNITSLIMNSYRWELVKLLDFLTIEEQQSISNGLLDLTLTYSEKDQARYFDYFICYLSYTNKEIVLDAIEKMESVVHKAYAIAKILDAFEGKNFISLAKKLLELVEISIDERETEVLICLLLNSIGKKLDS